MTEREIFKTVTERLPEEDRHADHIAMHRKRRMESLANNLKSAETYYHGLSSKNSPYGEICYADMTSALAAANCFTDTMIYFDDEKQKESDG